MKLKMTLICASILLAACNPAPVQKESDIKTQTRQNVPQPMKTFKQLCFANAGKPAAIIAAGNAAGFNMRSLATNSATGFRKSTDESLQVNAFTTNTFECAVTTSPTLVPKSWTRQFFAHLGLKTRTSFARVEIGGTEYIVAHRSKGGEAFVIYKK